MCEVKFEVKSEWHTMKNRKGNQADHRIISYQVNVKDVFKRQSSSNKLLKLA